MFNWNEFDKLFNEFFSSSFDDKNWTKNTYSSPDGLYSMSYMTRNFNNTSPSDELYVLKEKLSLAIKEENFEEAVNLRDEIKKLEKNKEELSKLKFKLDECIRNQDFERAIEYRDKIKSLK